LAKANFVYLPKKPEPISVFIRPDYYGQAYFQDPVIIPFTVKKPYFGSITRIVCSIDGEEDRNIVGSARGEYWVTLKELSEGWHNITIKVTGKSTYIKGYTVKHARVSDVKSIKFLVDNVPPKISVLSPQNDDYVKTDVPLNFTVSELAKWIGYSLDGQANVTINGNTTLPELSYGSHSLTVYANDTVGRFGTSEQIYFTIVQETTPETQPETPEFPSWTPMLLTLIILAVAIAHYKRRLPKTQKR
jgi:hypothetical protein